MFDCSGRAAVVRISWAISCVGRQSLSSRDERRGSSDISGRLRGSVCLLSAPHAVIALLVCGWLVLGPTHQASLQAAPIHIGTAEFDREMARNQSIDFDSHSSGAGAVQQPLELPAPSQPNQPPGQLDWLFGGLGESTGGMGTGTSGVSSSAGTSALATASHTPESEKVLWRSRSTEVLHTLFEPTLVFRPPRA